MNEEQIQLMVQASVLYYEQEWNQQQIAAKLGITRQTVSKLIGEAKRNGIVDIRIHNPLKDLEELSETLRARYGLREAIVVPSSFRDEDLIRSMLAQRAARYLMQVLQQGDCRNLALSWGRTVYETVAQLAWNGVGNLTVFPLLGASNRTAPCYMLNEMVRAAAAKLDAQAIYACIPAAPDTPEDNALFRQTTAYRTMAALWGHIDVAFVSIGAGKDGDGGSRARFPGEPEGGADACCGDLCTHFFDGDGRFCDPQAGNMLCASVRDFRSAKRVIATAGGPAKAQAILGGLKTGIVTDLIIDELTCALVLQAGL